jgi:hypothetical protein
MTRPDPYQDMADHELLRKAAAHLRRAEALPAGNLLAARERLRFHHVMAEFDRRQLMRLLRWLKSGTYESAG